MTNKSLDIIVYLDKILNAYILSLDTPDLLSQLYGRLNGGMKDIEHIWSLIIQIAALYETAIIQIQLRAEGPWGAWPGGN
jgi:hypothetical protein